MFPTVNTKQTGRTPERKMKMKRIILLTAVNLMIISGCKNPGNEKDEAFVPAPAGVPVATDQVSGSGPDTNLSNWPKPPTSRDWVKQSDMVYANLNKNEYWVRADYYAQSTEGYPKIEFEKLELDISYRVTLHIPYGSTISMASYHDFTVNGIKNSMCTCCDSQFGWIQKGYIDFSKLPRNKKIHTVVFQYRKKTVQCSTKPVNKRVFMRFNVLTAAQKL
ncbi:MAG: hypothetical protein ABIH87_04600 [bacterium]